MAFGTELNEPDNSFHLMFYMQTIPYHLQPMNFGTELNELVESFILVCYIQRRHL
jgi:hypothetical protein